MVAGYTHGITNTALMVAHLLQQRVYQGFQKVPFTPIRFRDSKGCQHFTSVNLKVAHTFWNAIVTPTPAFV